MPKSNHTQRERVSAFAQEKAKLMTPANKSSFGHSVIHRFGRCSTLAERTLLWVQGYRGSIIYYIAISVPDPQLMKTNPLCRLPTERTNERTTDKTQPKKPTTTNLQPTRSTLKIVLNFNLAYINLSEICIWPIVDIMFIICPSLSCPFLNNLSYNILRVRCSSLYTVYGADVRE